MQTKFTVVNTLEICNSKDFVSSFYRIAAGRMVATAYLTAVGVAGIRISWPKWSFHVKWTNFRDHPHFNISYFNEILPVASNSFKTRSGKVSASDKQWLV